MRSICHSRVVGCGADRAVVFRNTDEIQGDLRADRRIRRYRPVRKSDRAFAFWRWGPSSA
jgi:hypothetical protein